MSTSAEFHRMVSDYEEKIAALRTELAEAQARIEVYKRHEAAWTEWSERAGSLPDDAAEQILEVIDDNLGYAFGGYPGVQVMQEPIKALVRSWSAAAPTAAERQLEATRQPGLVFRYKNHRGDTAVRTVRPLRVYYGTSEWHSRPTWLMDAWDVDKLVERTFDMTQMHMEHFAIHREAAAPTEPPAEEPFGARLNRESMERFDRERLGSSETTSEPATPNDHCEKTVTIEGRTYRCVRRVLHLGEHEYHEPETTSGPTPSEPIACNSCNGSGYNTNIFGQEFGYCDDCKGSGADLRPVPAENTEGSEQ